VRKAQARMIGAKAEARMIGAKVKTRLNLRFQSMKRPKVKTESLQMSLAKISGNIQARAKKVPKARERKESQRAKEKVMDRALGRP